jgi:hypothetical protein
MGRETRTTANVSCWWLPRTETYSRLGKPLTCPDLSIELLQFYYSLLDPPLSLTSGLPGLASSQIAAAPSSLVGQTLGHHRVVEQIGAGPRIVPRVLPTERQEHGLTSYSRMPNIRRGGSSIARPDHFTLPRD